MKSNNKNKQKFSMYRWMQKNKKKIVSAVCIIIIFTMVVSTFSGLLYLL